MASKLVVALLVLSLAGEAYLWHRVSTLEAATPAAGGGEYPLGETMGYLQRYADKLWYAGEAGSWDLAAYYRDELEETAGDVMAAGVVKDGFQVSQNMRDLLPPALADLKGALSSGDSAAFHQRYQAMVDQCDGCHVASGHPFIRVVVPQGPPAQWNQDFSPPPAGAAGTSGGR